MKGTIKGFFAMLGLLLIGVGAAAQQTQSYGIERSPAWVSEKGYWVVQSNTHTPWQHTVFFYDNENRLIQRLEIRGEKLNPEKRKTKIRLKKALDAALSGSQHKGVADLPLTTAIL